MMLAHFASAPVFGPESIATDRAPEPDLRQRDVQVLGGGPWSAGSRKPRIWRQQLVSLFTFCSKKTYLYIVLYRIILYQNHIILYYIIYECGLRFYDFFFPSFWSAVVLLSLKIINYNYYCSSNSTSPKKHKTIADNPHIYIYIHINDHHIYSSQIYILINDQFIHWHKTYEVLIRLNAEDGVAEAAGG